jgi:uncharacterized membrane protein YcgQ (UPF0703/DUF1980 family)
MHFGQLHHFIFSDKNLLEAYTWPNVGKHRMKKLNKVSWECLMYLLTILIKIGKLPLVHLSYSRKYCEITMLTHLTMRRSFHELNITHKFTFLMTGNRTVQNRVVSVSSTRLKLKAQQYSYREFASSVIFLQQIYNPALTGCPVQW